MLCTASLSVAGCLWWSNVSAQHRGWWMQGVNRMAIS